MKKNRLKEQNQDLRSERRLQLEQLHAPPNLVTHVRSED